MVGIRGQVNIHGKRNNIDQTLRQYLLRGTRRKRMEIVNVCFYDEVSGKGIN